VDSDYGARYRDLYERHWWWLARKRVILDTLRAHEPAGGWGNVLDIGCGDGLFFDELAKLPGVQLVEGAFTSSHSTRASTADAAIHWS
jgi:2-polyprenyl-3-methyl-5-hydroxy-6-metoxy-1,4-benzoquinol methylase